MDHPNITVTRVGTSILIEIPHGAALLTVAQVEALHTELERAVSPIRAERQAAGR